MKHDTDILKRIKTYFMRRKSAGEAHAFEREIEKDPFLYEAMEGLEGMLTSDLQQALDELDYRLEDKVTVNPWLVNWKLAASVLLFIGVGTTIYFLVPESSAENEVVLEEKSNSYDPRNSKLEFEAVEYMDTTMEIAVADSFTTSIVLQDAIAGNAVKSVSQMPQMETEASPLEESDLVYKNKESEDELSNNVDGQTLFSDELSVESSGNADSGITVLNEYAMSSSTPVSSQEVSESMDLKIESKSARTKSEEVSVPVSTPPKPINGMASYRAYLKKNLRRTDGMPTGTVSVSFELDRSGKPKKVQVTKSLCTACDIEAVRLVTAGPNWESTDKKARVSVNVTFP